MRTFKESLNLTMDAIKTEANITAAKVVTGDKTAFSRGDKIAAFGTTITMLMIMCATPVHASSIIDSVTNWISTYYPQIAGLTTVLAAFLILIAILWTMLSPSQHGSAVPIGWIKKILICWIAALSVASIVALVKEMTKDTASWTPGN